MAEPSIGSLPMPYERRSRTHQKSQAFRHGFADNRLERTYRNIKDRCYNQTAQNYRYYGAEGVTICDEWLESNVAFYRWAIENGYRDDLFIDRQDNDKGYCPTNCRWVTRREQELNKRSKGNQHRSRFNCRGSGQAVDYFFVFSSPSQKQLLHGWRTGFDNAHAYEWQALLLLPIILATALFRPGDALR